MNTTEPTAALREPQQCPVCGVMRRTPETLRAHLGIAHPEQDAA